MKLSHCSSRRRTATILASLLLLILALAWASPPGAAAQEDGRKPTSRRPERGVPPGELDSRDDGLPREIGQILEVSEAELQSGNRSMRYLRRIANATYDWLLHLRISVVESDLQAIRYDRENCELLFELLDASNPSRILRDDIAEIRAAMEEDGGVASCMLGLQIDLERYDFLYPLADLRSMLTALMRAQQDRKPQQVRLGVKMLAEAVALPNIDGPIAASREAFAAAMASLDDGDSGEVRRQLKKSANLISLLNVGAYVTESLWHLARANHALGQRQFGIALASLKKADARLEDAEDRAWPEYAGAVSSVREDLDQVLTKAADRKLKLTLKATQLKAVAQRIDQELRIPY